MPERSSGTGPRRAHGAAPKAQAPLRGPPAPLPCRDVGNVSTSALLDGAAGKPLCLIRLADGALGTSSPHNSIRTTFERSPPFAGRRRWRRRPCFPRMLARHYMADSRCRPTQQPTLRQRTS